MVTQCKSLWHWLENTERCNIHTLLLRRESHRKASNYILTELLLMDSGADLIMQWHITFSTSDNQLTVSWKACLMALMGWSMVLHLFAVTRIQYFKRAFFEMEKCQPTMYLQMTERKSPWISSHSHIQHEEYNTDRDYHGFTLSIKPYSRKEILHLPSLSFHVIHVSSSHFTVCEILFNELWNYKVIMGLQHTEISYAVTVKGIKICSYSDKLLEIFRAIFTLFYCHFQMTWLSLLLA
jgi:hypothetical protein